MKLPANRMIRAAAAATVVSLTFAAGGPQAAADPQPNNASPFDIVNNTKYDLVFWDYSTTDKYPQTGPNHGDKAHPGEKFTFTLAQMDGSRSDKRNKGRTTIKANFHTFNAAGTDIPAGMATMDIAFDTGGNDVWTSSVNCWASQDRSCGPRPPQPGGQLFPGNVVTFTG
ncbi:hypothetical protein A5647_05970 [Mycobacterium sp. 1100029.7]|nr:hypothetical protein A5647_05970 [Mycobacterium sp. 1100029.7]